MKFNIFFAGVMRIPDVANRKFFREGLVANECGWILVTGVSKEGRGVKEWISGMSIGEALTRVYQEYGEGTYSGVRVAKESFELGFKMAREMNGLGWKYHDARVALEDS